MFFKYLYLCLFKFYCRLINKICRSMYNKIKKSNNLTILKIYDRFQDYVIHKCNKFKIKYDIATERKRDFFNKLNETLTNK